jgi:hypothetical protein
MHNFTNTNPIKSLSVKKKRSFILLLFLGVWLALAWVIVFTILYNFITDRFDSELAIATLMIVLISLYLSRVFLWNLSGEESISFFNEYIEIRKKGLPFFSTFKIFYTEFEGVDTEQDKTPGVLRIYGIAGGKLNIKYLGKTIRFGQSIEDNEALQLKSEIELTLKAIQNI